MKNNLKNYLKVCILLFGISLLLWNCEKDTIIPIEQALTTKEKFHSRRISGSEIPDILNHITNKTKNAFTNSKSSTTNYGELDLEDIIEIVDTIGTINYSFRISNIDDDGLSLYNLVVHTDENGTADAPYVIKYTMEENFANGYYNGTKFFDEFTGTISRYTIDAFLSSHSSKYAKNDPVADCPCNEIDVVDGNNWTPGGSTGSSDGSFPDDNTEDSGNSGNGGGSGGQTCTLQVSSTTYACSIGDSDPHDSALSDLPDGSSGYCGGSITITVTYWECTNIDDKSFQKSGECEQDVNGNCPEDDGYVGVNTDDNTLSIEANKTYFSKKSDDPEAIPIELDEIINCFETTGNENGYHDITIYVDQPVANSREINSGANAGHTFIKLTQGLNDNVTTRYIGFYPEEEDVSPNKPIVIGGFYDDGGHSYDVSLTVELTSTQFNSIIQYLDDISPEAYYTEYDLNDYNCSDFGLSAFNLSGINVPDSTGVWGGEYGYDLGQGTCPALLGQDIRNTSFGSNAQKDTNGGNAGSSSQNDCN